jgi:hypothetical protein
MMINEIINKKYMVVQPYNPSSWEYEAGGSRVQDQSELHWEFQASLGKGQDWPSAYYNLTLVLLLLFP